jgi:hypothetical protein
MGRVSDEQTASLAKPILVAAQKKLLGGLDPII